MDVHELGFPLGIRLTHWFNFLFMTMLIRSGLDIISGLPKFYWDDGCVPGTEWLSLARKKMPENELWTSHDEMEDWPTWLALPGGPKFGIARSWHFAAAVGWTFTGMLYLALLFTSDHWHRLIPSSWQVFPDALGTAGDYLHLRLRHPSETGDEQRPFNALQQLTYFGVIFLLAPFQILTGIAQSPAIEAHFTWPRRLLGGRQGARSLHLIGMALFVLFLVGHVVMVLLHGWAAEMDRMVLGVTHGAGSSLGAWSGVGVIVGVILVNWAATRASWADSRRVADVLDAIVDPFRMKVLHRLYPRYQLDDSTISPFMRVNGRPPTAEYPTSRSDEYIGLMEGGFADWRLQIGGLVENPLGLSLEDIKALPRKDQTTMHNCVQGWTAIAKWGGVPLSEIIDRCRPRPGARYVVFRSYQKYEEGGGKEEFYETLDLELARHSQTILAYEMNGKPLPINHGAPLRLRVETVVGYKMVKWLRAIEFIEDYRDLGAGRGGSREDGQLMGKGAEI
jgi:sulfoxide reductase catalytic subunit YedY